MRAEPMGDTRMRQGMLDTHDAAELLGVSPRTLEAWRVRGGGPRYVVLGDRGVRRGAVRYRREDLDGYVAARVRASTSAAGPPSEAA